MYRLLILSVFFLQVVTFAQPVYYPLEVGNRWDYWHFVTEVIRDTVMPNGKTYAAIWDDYGPMMYHRAESTRVYQYLPYAGKEFILADFTLNIGDTVSSEPFYVTVFRKGNYSIFGRELRGWEFFVDRDTTGADDEYSLLIVDSIGVAEYTGTFAIDELGGATINGISYGNLVSIISHEETLPTNVQLGQNYPNPFNSGTEVSYSLSRGSFASIIVYDPLGKQVRRDDLGYLQPGVYRHSLYLGNLATGFYTYRLMTDQEIIQRRMLLIR